MDVAFIFLIPPQILVTTIFFFFSYFGNALPQIFFFFPYFGNGIATIGFFFLAHPTSSTQHTYSGSKNFDNHIIEIHAFSLSHFFSFSLILLLNFGNDVVEIYSLSLFS